jgi:predicted aldo/keto reductase-like oxidoreductase
LAQCAFLLQDDGTQDEKISVRMLRDAIDSGVNYIDTAYLYHEGESELITGNALADGYRSKTFLATKSPIWLLNNSDDFDRILDEQLKKLKTDHIDLYLLHNIRKEYWRTKVLDFNLFEKAQKAKKAGKVRYIGFSLHDDFNTFKQVTDFYPWDFCQIQLNYMDTAYQAGLGGLRHAAKKGLGVVIMEPLKGGNLANIPASVQAVFDRSANKRTPVEWALSYLWDMPEVSLVLSGMSSPLQTEENIAYAARSRIGCLSADERKIVAAANKEFRNITAIPCTACSYCMPCPHRIAIPYAFTAFNDYHIGNRERAEHYYREVVHRFGKMPCECTTCKECEKLCPQGLKISTLLADVHKLFG